MNVSQTRNDWVAVMPVSFLCVICIFCVVCYETPRLSTQLLRLIVLNVLHRLYVCAGALFLIMGSFLFRVNLCCYDRTHVDVAICIEELFEL